MKRKITTVCMQAVLTALFALCIPVGAWAQTTYTVAGSAAILNGTESWAPANADNDMSSEDGVNYSLTVSGVSVEAGSYEFKVVQDHSWEHNWPSSNWVLTISESAKYDIVYTFNAESKDINAIATKVGEYEESGEKIYTVAGSEAILGSNWGQTDTNNDMVKGDDGIYRLVKENVELEAATYEYKVVLNHDWGTAYPSSNAQLVIDAAGTYTVVFTFNGDTKEVSATAFTNPVTFNFADPKFRENVGEAMADVKGYIYNETFAVGQTTLQITGGSAPSRIYVDANRGQNLVTYTQYTTLTFNAPQGLAITKIEFTAAGNSNINKFSASSGTIEEMTWTGNAEGVRFAQGGTSYLANAIVTLAVKDANTTALPAIEYTECANIAAFNALEAGTYAKVTLTDAEVIGKSADGYSTVWIQDATGGCWIQYTSLNDKLQENSKVNGFVYVVKRVVGGNPQMKEAEATINSEFTTEGISIYTIQDGATIAAVDKAENVNRIVRLTGASFEATSATAGKLTLGEETIDVSNGNATANQQLHKLEWEKGDKMENVIIVAILTAKSATANQLLPISMESAVFTVAGGFNTSEGGLDDVIFGKTWEPTIEDNDLVRGEDGLYTKTFENVSLEAGTILYKVVKNHSWNTQDWGFNGNNADYVVNAAGTYNITFTFNPVALLDNGFNLTCSVVPNEATGIVAVERNSSRQDAVFNLNGQRVVKAQKGLYISNGRKVMMK